MIVNEALPVITDGVIGGGIVAVVVSTALVVMYVHTPRSLLTISFAEIIPQSVCSRHGLAIGAKMAPVVRVLIILFLPLGWPIAKLLEYILGAHHGIIYRRSELRELIQMHAAAKGAGGDLDNDTITMAQGALDLAGKTAKDAMTPIDDVFVSIGRRCSDTRCFLLRPSWIMKPSVRLYAPVTRVFPSIRWSTFPTLTSPSLPARV